MKVYKFLSLSLISLVGLGACNELSGVLHISENITLTETYNDTGSGGGFPGGRPQRPRTRPLELTAGNYEAKIGGSSNKLVVTLKLKKPAQLVFNTKGAQVPNGSGPIDIPSKISGQPVDVKGSLDVNVSDSEARRDMESCTYVRRVLQCSWSNGHQYCWWEDQHYPGRRYVEYFVRTTVQTLSSQLLKPETDISVGQLGGSRSESERVYTFYGECR